MRQPPSASDLDRAVLLAAREMKVFLARQPVLAGGGHDRRRDRRLQSSYKS